MFFDPKTIGRYIILLFVYEFPKGLKVISFDENGDSITISSNYGISYSKTQVTEIRDKVIIDKD